MFKCFFTLVMIYNVSLSQSSHLNQHQFRIGANPLISSIGFGSNLNVEYGIIKNLGLKINIGSNRYETVDETWNILPLDLWVTYHGDFNLFGDSGYVMFGISQTYLSVKNYRTHKTIADVNYFTSFAYGLRFRLAERFMGFGEARYRVGEFDIKTSKLDVTWRSIAAGVSYDLN